MNNVDTYKAHKATLQPEYIMNVSERFNKGVVTLKGKLEKALADLNGDTTGESNTSDPLKLAKYQSALSAYTLFCNAQSSSVKAFKDIAAATISNFR